MFEPLAAVPEVLASIERTHDLVHGGPQGDDASAYAMVVPKRWARATAFGCVTTGMGIPEPIGAFLLHPSPGSPALLVSRARFAFEIGVEDFLRHRSACDRLVDPRDPLDSGLARSAAAARGRARGSDPRCA